MSIGRNISKAELRFDLHFKTNQREQLVLVPEQPNHPYIETSGAVKELVKAWNVTKDSPNRALIHLTRAHQIK